MILENCYQGEGPMSDIDPNNKLTLEDAELLQRKNSRKRRREQAFVTRDMITALALCHNVTPTYPEPEDRSIVEFQASSPDEVALVKFADQIGLKLVERDQQIIEILNAAGVSEKYDVLVNFPFSSDTKRMGIALRH